MIEMLFSLPKALDLIPYTRHKQGREERKQRYPRMNENRSPIVHVTKSQMSNSTGEMRGRKRLLFPVTVTLFLLRVLERLLCPITVTLFFLRILERLFCPVTVTLFLLGVLDLLKPLVFRCPLKNYQAVATGRGQL